MKSELFFRPVWYFVKPENFGTLTSTPQYYLSRFIDYLSFEIFYSKDRSGGLLSGFTTEPDTRFVSNKSSDAAFE